MSVEFNIKTEAPSGGELREEYILPVPTADIKEEPSGVVSELLATSVWSLVSKSHIADPCTFSKLGYFNGSRLFTPTWKQLRM